MHCIDCNSPMGKTIEHDYVYDLSGLSSVILRDIETFKCPNCDYGAVSFRAMEKLHDALAQEIAAKDASLLPEEVRFLRDYLGMTNEEFARTMGVTPNQASRWMSGPMGSSAERLLRLLVAKHSRRLDVIERVACIIKNDLRLGHCTFLGRFAKGHWRITVAKRSADQPRS